MCTCNTCHGAHGFSCELSKVHAILSCVNVQLFELLHTVAIASWQTSLKDEAHFAPSLL